MRSRFKVMESLSEILFPENMYCICCGDILPPSRVHGLCDDCISHLSWLSENPFSSRLSEFSFDSVLSLVEYDFFAQKIIHDLKFHEKNYIARPLGKLMGELYLEYGGAENAVFVPVPMHSSKERMRGYNQAALLAFYASKSSGCEYIKDALIKNKPTASMRTSRALGRMNALDNSIEINIAHARDINGRNIVLVDDVITTGSTAEACSGVLKHTGAQSVCVLSFAAVNYKGN